LFEGREYHRLIDEGAGGREEIEFEGLPLHLQMMVRDRPGHIVRETKFADYTLPGGQNYREVMLTLPSKRDMSVGGVGAIDMSKEFKGGHFDQPNVLAHFRIDDRTGPNGEKILFVEEIQSDWHQAGRRLGYQGKVGEAVDSSKWRADHGGRASNQARGRWVIYNKQGGVVGSGVEAETAEEAIRITAELMADEPVADRGQVPDAPFKGNAWAELSMKRLIRMAAEGGYAQLAWTTGEQQAERYDLSTKIDEVRVEQVYDDGRAIELVLPDGGLFRVVVNDNAIIETVEQVELQRLEGKPLDEAVGKDLADKIMMAEEQTVLTGDDLKVGGEGMKSFYD
ncbi:hypothetical protein LCGC14_3137600, partial [marine sediment metagenome]